MLFYSKDLIEVAPFCRTTYFKKLKELKEKKKIKLKLSGKYITEEDALSIADHLGFKKEFEKFISTQTK